jgi:hypothetical protein
MRLETFAAWFLIIVTAVPPATAQRQESPAVWRAFAEKLEAGAFVRVTLKNHTKVKGHFIMIEGDTLRVKPYTRVPVPIRDFRFSDIDSIDRQREGWSPGAKVATGVAAGVGVVLLIGLALLMSLD